MTKNDWYKAGDQIKNLVQDAIDTGDFSQLGNTISDVISDAMDGLQGALHGDSGDKGQYGARGTTASHSGSTCDEYDQTYRESEERARRAYEQTAGQGRQTYGRTAEAGGRNTRTYQPVPTGRKLPGEFGSRVMEYLGFGMGAIFGLGFGLSVLAAFAMDSLFLLWGSVSTVGLMCVVSLLLGMGGQRRLGVTRRFRRYCEVIGTRTYCKIEELAAGIGENSGYVKKDLKKMIRRGYFPVGYLDRKETLLITDQATYQQYLQAEEAYEKRQDEQKNAGKRTQEDTKESKRENTQENTRGAAASSSEQSSEQPVRTAEHQALIEEGQKYIRHIHECNQRIPGAEVTAKLDRLELVVTRIFQVAEKDPDSVSDLRKMMSYYLPTTRKLLDAYCELDNQPICGENIESTKLEIEKALDTINTAFEKLLDSLYEEQAWDISSDISVLNTMLAQEGLTKKDFE